MKTNATLKRAMLGLGLAALVSAGAVLRADAAALNPSLSLRPLSPQEVKDYALTGNLTASGLNTIAINQPAYLEVLINNAIPSTTVPVITWTLTNAPLGSVAVITNSPLGTNVPPYKIADRPGKTSTAWKVASRRMFKPDVVGQYTFRVNITTATNGSTNLTLTITAGTFLGANTCALCHSGGVVADNTYTGWIGTLHAHAFTDAIDGKSTDHFTK